MNARTLSLLNQTYCRIRPSTLGGVGVFAIRDIPTGTNPFVGCQRSETYDLVTHTEAGALSFKIHSMLSDFFIETENGFIIPDCGLNGMDISFFVNHSKTPNLSTSDGSLTMVSNQEIPIGVELTIDYNTYSIFKNESK